MVVWWWAINWWRGGGGPFFRNIETLRAGVYCRPARADAVPEFRVWLTSTFSHDAREKNNSGGQSIASTSIGEGIAGPLHLYLSSSFDAQLASVVFGCCLEPYEKSSKFSSPWRPKELLESNPFSQEVIVNQRSSVVRGTRSHQIQYAIICFDTTSSSMIEWLSVLSPQCVDVGQSMEGIRPRPVTPPVASRSRLLQDQHPALVVRPASNAENHCFGSDCLIRLPHSSGHFATLPLRQSFVL